MAPITLKLPRKNKTAASPINDVLMNAAQVRAHFGGISDMCLWRWVHDPAKGFPQPTIINKRRYWRASEIEAFVAAHEQAK